MPEQEGKDLPKLKNRRGREDTQKIKKIILLSFAGMLLFVVLFYTGAYLIDKYATSSNPGDKNNYNPTNQTITFYTPDYNEDIYKDSYYIGLDRNIYYYDPGTGLTTTISEADYYNFNEGVRFMHDFVNHIIAGDSEEYNECFSLDYYLEDGNEEKDSFTMQKLYNIKITKVSETTGTGAGDIYIYMLEYMIHKNNGTFRTDMGSDASRTQYITITNKRGKLLIDAVNVVVIR